MRSTILPDLHRPVPQHLARRFAQICNALRAEAFGPHEPMPGSFALLSQIHATPGMDRNWLARATGFDATSTGQALREFARRGLVERGIQPSDRRAGAFSLTPAGEALFAELSAQTRALAARLLAKPAAEDRLNAAFLLAVGRGIKPSERAALEKLIADQQAYYAANPAEAAKLLKVGLTPPPKDDLPAHAAWTQACRVLLNSHEVITRY